VTRYSEMTPTQLLSIVRAFGWRLVPGRSARLHLEPVAVNARVALPPGLTLAIKERSVAIRTILALESSSGSSSFTAHLGDP